MGWFKMVAVVIGLGGLGLRLGMLIMEFVAEPDPTMMLYSDDALTLLLQGLLAGFLGPLILLAAAGGRRGPVFAAGLGLTVPALLTLGVTAALWGRPLAFILLEMMGFDVLMLNLALLPALAVAASAAFALARDRRGRPAGRGLSQGVMALALVPAGSLVLAFFLILGYHQGQSPPRLEELWPDSPERRRDALRIADLDMWAPPGFQEGTMEFYLGPGRNGLWFYEVRGDSSRRTDQEMGLSLGLEGQYDENTLAAIREIEERARSNRGQNPGAEQSTPDPAGPADSGLRPGGAESFQGFRKNVLVELGRDMSEEIGRPARLVVMTGYGPSRSRRERVGQLEMSLVVRAGDTGLIRLSQNRAEDPDLTEDSPEQAAFRLRAVNEFLGRAKAIFRRYQWQEPDRALDLPGFYTRFGCLTPAGPKAQRRDPYGAARSRPGYVRLTFGDLNNRLNLRLQRPSRFWRSGMEDDRLDSALAIIRSFYQGRRFWSGPRAVAGNHGRLELEYPARPGPLLVPRYDHSARARWLGADQSVGGDKPYELILTGQVNPNRPSEAPRFLNLTQTILTNFHFVGDGS